jgi:hypothetical protein
VLPPCKLESHQPRASCFIKQEYYSWRLACMLMLRYQVTCASVTERCRHVLCDSHLTPQSFEKNTPHHHYRTRPACCKQAK